MNGKSYIVIVAGEASGDRLGLEIIKGSSLNVKCFKGVGGHLMTSVGFESIISMNTISVNGFIEVFPVLPILKKIEKQLQVIIDNELCLGLILIDYPGFNMRLMNYAKSLNKKVCYLAPPQIWAWKEKRGQKFKDCLVGVFFDFEKDIYQKYGAIVEKIEHPALANFIGYRKISQSIFEAKVKCYNNRILLFPGSRISRIKDNLKLFLKLAKTFELQKPSNQEILEIIIVAPNLEIKQNIEKQLMSSKYSQFIEDIDGIIVFDELKEMIQKSNLTNHSSTFKNYALSIPGTNNLELTIMGIPIISLIKVDLLSYIWGRFFLSAKFFSLPNILLNKKIINEFLFCFDFQSNNLEVSKALDKLWYMADQSANVSQEFYKDIGLLEQSLKAQSLSSWMNKQIGAWLDV